MMSSGYDIVFVAVTKVSQGTDSISCRDIRYKGEDISAYQFIESGSGSSDQPVSAAASTAIALTSSVATALTVAEKTLPITVHVTLNPPPTSLQLQPELSCQVPLPVACQPQQSVVSRPISTQPPVTLQPFASQQQEQLGKTSDDLTQPGNTQPSELSRPVIGQQLELINSLPSAVTTNMTMSTTPAGHLYQPSAVTTNVTMSTTPAGQPSASCLASNQPTPVSPQSFLLTGTPAIPQPTVMHDFQSRPPPPFEFSTPVMPQVEARQPQLWVPPPQMTGSLMRYPSRPMPAPSSSQTPGVLCRPSTSQMRGVVPSPESAVKQFQALSLSPSQIDQVTGMYQSGVGDAPPPPLIHPYNPHFSPEFSAFGHRPDYIPSTNQELQPSPSYMLSYGQREFGNAVSWNQGAGPVFGSNDGGAGEGYDQLAYSTQCNEPYVPASHSALNASPNTWLPGQPVTEFQPAAEFPTDKPVPPWPPAAGYLYMPPNSGLEPPQMMYPMASAGPVWDFSRAAMPYMPRFSVPNYTDIPPAMLQSSLRPPTTQVQGDTVGPGSDVSGNQSDVSAGMSPNIHRQSYADITRSAPTFRQNDGHIPHPTTERRDFTPHSTERRGVTPETAKRRDVTPKSAERRDVTPMSTERHNVTAESTERSVVMPESGDRGETSEHSTTAGAFFPGNSILIVFSFFAVMHSNSK